MSLVATQPHGSHRSARTVERESQDQRLLRLLDGGDQRALATIYDRHAGVAFALARRMCGPERAEDAVAHAFLALARDAGAAQGEGGIRPLVLHLTREYALDLVHDRDWHGRIEGDAGTSSSARSVGELLERHAAGALQAVASADREFLELASFDGLTRDEIATRSEMSPAAVSEHLRRGLNGKLRYVRESAQREATPPPPRGRRSRRVTP